MIKTFLISIICSISLSASQQILLVVAHDFNTSSASLEFFEDDTIIYTAKVNLGKNGLGWGVGVVNFSKKKGEPYKHEGDNRAPAGVFKLGNTFGYGYTHEFSLPYLHTAKELICVDDSTSHFYNQIIQAHGDEKSFEYMQREDNQYKYGVTVQHNQEAIPQRGSCIFLHIQKEEGSGTAGCTSMREKDLLAIMHLLKRDKNPLLVQVTKSSRDAVLQYYPQLKNSKLFTQTLP